ncbi:uncharacterized protein LOC129224804 [Uloborus diversus]|uniref:uncharacterized protein LOC129224804 n=1 Tax=Uloborus diversus TaxID=327109 RepID=UPI0024096662|nr:uncharacterized protein LOC129224804 [Uloborus diversus]
MPLETDIEFIDTSVNNSDFSVTTVSSVTSSQLHNDPVESVSSAVSEVTSGYENIPPKEFDFSLQKMAFTTSQAESYIKQMPSTSYASSAVLLADTDFMHNTGATSKKLSVDSTQLFGSNESGIVFQFPNMAIPPDIQFIDETGSHYNADASKNPQPIDVIHSSFRIPKKPPSRRRLCRHHSDSETRQQYQDRASSTPRYNPEMRPRTKRVRRSVSAIEGNKSRYRPRVRRSVSDRSGLIVAGKHLAIPRSRPHSISDIRSSKCSSTKTLASNLSMSDVVAVELGMRNIPGLTAKEARRKRIVCTVMVITMTILIVSAILVVVTLFLSPEVDAILRKGNEEIYRSMSAGASTSSPTTEGAVVTNNSTPPSGTPG